MLARNLVRGKTATAEVRGEEAAELLSMLQTRRVIIDPASMELRFSDEALHPKIELDRSSNGALRTQIVFVQPSSGRRFPMTQGAWFEGTPGWTIDASDGFARPLADKVTPEWLSRLSKTPSLTHPADQLSAMLTEHLPRVAGFLGAETPDLSEVADLSLIHI